MNRNKFSQAKFEVIVAVPFKTEIPYKIQVQNPADLEEIKAKLKELDPSNWLSDPDLYMQFGSGFNDLIAALTEQDILEVKETDFAQEEDAVR